MEVAQEALQVDSPLEVAQEAFKLIQTEEQMERLLEFIRQQNLERSRT